MVKVAQGAKIRYGVAGINDTLRLMTMNFSLGEGPIHGLTLFCYRVSAQGRNGRKQLVNRQAAVGFF